MIVGGMMFQSFIEHRGKILAGVFLSGCNFSCPWCHNKGLIEGKGKIMDPKDVLDELVTNNFLIDGILISGGEPTLQHDLLDFVMLVKEKYPNFLVVLNTNGTKTEMIKKVIPFVDILTVDFKGSADEYEKFLKSGFGGTIYDVRETLKLTRPTDEVRLTVVSKEFNERKLNFIANFFYEIRSEMKAQVILQAYRPPPGEYGNYMITPSDQEINELANFLILTHGLKVKIRK